MNKALTLLGEVAAVLLFIAAMIGILAIGAMR
jgi:hypothetical protein